MIDGDNKDLLFEGAISTKAAMLAGNRTVYRIVIDKTKKDKDTAFIKRQAEARGIPVDLVAREEIDALADGKTHGGLISLVGERTYQHIEQVLQGDTPFLAILEGIEDPFNFAYALRSLYASGCDGVIVSERNWTSAASVIAKASAGASEYCNIVVSTDFQETIQKMKRHGIRILSCMRDNAIPYFQEDLTKRICLAIGGELRGLSKLVLENSDQNIYIPYGSTFRNALTASSATSIVAFEVVRQRFSSNPNTI